MYRCDFCNAKSEPRRQKLVHQVKRLNGQIHREYACCEACKLALDTGVSVATLCQNALKFKEVQPISVALRPDNPHPLQSTPILPTFAFQPRMIKMKKGNR